jgi:ABC-type transport system involved in multi-copper enzyme maturation permease subunit
MNFAFFRDLGIHAVHEWRDALRSKRAIVVLLVYLGGSLTLCNFFVSFVKKIEDSALAGLGVAANSGAGAVTQTIWETRFFRGILKSVAGDDYLADHLVTVEPLAVFYFWITNLFAPIILMLIAPTRVSEELSTGSSRFVLFRSSLGSWVLGKYFGQLFLLLPAMLVSGLGAWVIAWVRLDNFDGAGIAADLLQYSLLMLCYLSALLGAATGFSQMTRSSNLATSFGFLFLILTSALYGASLYFRNEEKWVPFWRIVSWLLPQGHRKDLLYPDLSHLLSAGVILFCLGIAYMLPGYRLLSRRDV